MVATAWEVILGIAGMVCIGLFVHSSLTPEDQKSILYCLLSFQAFTYVEFGQLRRLIEERTKE